MWLMHAHCNNSTRRNDEEKDAQNGALTTYWRIFFQLQTHLHLHSMASAATVSSSSLYWHGIFQRIETHTHIIRFLSHKTNDTHEPYTLHTFQFIAIPYTRLRSFSASLRWLNIFQFRLHIFLLYFILVGANHIYSTLYNHWFELTCPTLKRYKMNENWSIQLISVEFDLLYRNWKARCHSLCHDIIEFQVEYIYRNQIYRTIDKDWATVWDLQRMELVNI